MLILFNVEATPAHQAGFKTAIVVRDGNAPLSEDEAKSFNLIKSFSELLPEETVPSKKSRKL